MEIQVPNRSGGIHIHSWDALTDSICRLNYILWIQDIVQATVLPSGKPVRGIDMCDSRFIPHGRCSDEYLSEEQAHLQYTLYWLALLSHCGNL
jgi:hypothetical protein